MQSSQLDRRFVGFRTAVAKERFAEATRRQHFGKVTLSLGVPSIRDVNQPSHLILNGLHHSRWTVAKNIATPARKQIEVSFPLSVPNIRAFAAHE